MMTSAQPPLYIGHEATQCVLGTRPCIGHEATQYNIGHGAAQYALAVFEESTVNIIILYSWII